MFHAVVLTCSLFLFWMLLSGFWDNSFLIITGLVCAVFSVWIERLLRKTSFSFDAKFAFLFPFYMIWLMGEIWKANVDTAKRILLPGKYPIDPCLAKLRVSQSTDIGKAVYANSITITPGTVSVDLKDSEVFVHALAAESIEELREGAMDRMITRLEAKT